MNDLYEFDVESKNWKKLPTSKEIKGRGGPCLSAIGDDLYVISGFSGEENKDVHKFSDGAWTKLADFPSCLVPRSVAAACSINSLNLICVIGGETATSEKGHEGAGNFTKEVICLPCFGD